jgi:outer membrane protein assembly factor BamB
VSRRRWFPRFALLAASGAALTAFGWPAALANTPTISPAPSAAPPGSVIVVSGSGFGASEAVDIYLDTTDVALGVTDGAGTFSKSITISSTATYETHWITAVGRRSGLAAQEPFVVSANWAQFRRTPLHNGYDPHENALSPESVGRLGPEWSYTTGGDINSSPAVVNGVLYVASSDRDVYALDSSTGALLWSFDTGGDPAEASPAVVDGVVYVSSLSHKVFALNAATGSLLWSRGVHAGTGSSPSVANGVVYIGTRQGRVYALNAYTGAVLWSYLTYGAEMVESSPAVANGVVYIGAHEYVYALSASTGAVLWSHQVQTYFGSSPAVANGVVFIGADDGNVYAFKASTGALLWTHEAAGLYVRSSPAVVSGIVYVGSDVGNVYALSASTGTTVWTYRTAGYVFSSPAVANGVVYVGSLDSNVYALDAATGALLWSHSMAARVESSPAVANGVVYVGSADNHVYAFSLPGLPDATSRPDPNRLSPRYN